MTFQQVHRLGFLAALGLIGATASSCGSPTPPSKITDPPSISCPPLQVAQSQDRRPVLVTYPDPIVTGGERPFTLSCTPVSGASFAVGTMSVTCMVTDAQRRSSSCTFPVMVEVPPTPRVSVTAFVAFGDSITRGEDGRNSTAFRQSQPGRVRPLNVFPDPQTYPGVLQAELTARYTAQTPTVANAGCPGEKITDRGTLKRFSDDTGGGRYGAVLILEGANDLESRDATVVPAAIAGLRQMVGYARMGNVRPYLATLTPMNPAGSRGGAWSLVPGFNDQIRILANSEGVTLVDVYQALNVDISTYIGFDGLHPTAQGYAKIADTFFAAVRQTLETLVPSSRGVVKGNLLGRRIQSPSGAAVVTCSPP